MRVLVATTANDGHFGPLLPHARALAAAGHEVRVAAPASYAVAVERSGLAHEPFADAPPELIGPVMASLPSLGLEEADEVVIREVFGRIDAQAGLPAVTEAVERWRPHLVLRESAELASLVAAERAGVPHVHVSIGMHEVVPRFAESVAEPLEELGGLGGLADGVASAALAAEEILSAVPESVDGGGLRWRFRDPDLVAGQPDGLPPAWGDPAHPLVYVTFGSVAGSLPPFAGVYAESVAALADRPVRVLMTVGRGFDVASLGTLPPHVCVLPWWPQVDVLAHAAAMVGHGGFGTTLGALANGVPQVVVPLFSFDQRVNAEHVAACGAGIAVPPADVAAAAAALESVLEDPSYADRAGAVAADVAALPPVSEAVGVLEEIAGV